MKIGDIFTILVIVFALSVLVFVVGSFIVQAFALPTAENNDNDYKFVHCYDEGTGGTINYPPGTECLTSNTDTNNKELTDDDLEEDEELADEQEHLEESDEWINEENGQEEEK